MPRTLTTIVAVAAIVVATALPARAAELDGLAPTAIAWQGPLRSDPLGDHGGGSDIDTYRMSYDSATDELVMAARILNPSAMWTARLYFDLDRDRATGCDGADYTVWSVVSAGAVIYQSSGAIDDRCYDPSMRMGLGSFEPTTGVLTLRVPVELLGSPVSFDWALVARTSASVSDFAPDPAGQFVEEFGWVRPFSDVRTDAFYSGPIAWLRQTGFSTGIGTTGTYDPDGPVTRGQMATFLWRIVLEQDAPPAPFTDVQRPSFYAAAVDWLYDANVTTGVGGSNQFRPDDPVTRGQMVTFLWRMKGSPTGYAAPGFTDVGTGAFYFEAVAWARAEGITTGVGGTNQFRPDDVVTRGQMAAFLQRTFAPYSSAIYMT